MPHRILETMMKKIQPHPQGYFQMKERGGNCAQTTIGHGNAWRILHSPIYLFDPDTLFHLALTTILE